MASQALAIWNGSRQDRLNELERIHAEIAGETPGRKWYTTQINRSYVVALAAQFQGFCRDLHSEAAAALAATAPPTARSLIEANLTYGRFVDKGNATAGNLGNDFGRLGLNLWQALKERDGRSTRRQIRLEQIMIWRNSIAHDTAIVRGNLMKLEETRPTLTWGRRWRRSLIGLAPTMDRVVSDALHPVIGNRPW